MHTERVLISIIHTFFSADVFLSEELYAILIIIIYFCSRSNIRRIEHKGSRINNIMNTTSRPNVHYSNNSIFNNKKMNENRVKLEKQRRIGFVLFCLLYWIHILLFLFEKKEVFSFQSVPLYYAIKWRSPYAIETFRYVFQHTKFFDIHIPIFVLQFCLIVLISLDYAI